jgi:hypothetical protein
MKAYGGLDVKIHIFLTLAAAGDEWSASRPDRFTPGERAPSARWIGCWVDTIGGLVVHSTQPNCLFIFIQLIQQY